MSIFLFTPKYYLVVCFGYSAGFIYYDNVTNQFSIITNGLLLSQNALDKVLHNHWIIGDHIGHA